MKHYGIWIINNNHWMIDGNGIVFWTTSRVVAEAQLAISRRGFKGPIEIREF